MAAIFDFTATEDCDEDEDDPRSISRDNSDEIEEMAAFFGLTTTTTAPPLIPPPLSENNINHLEITNRQAIAYCSEEGGVRIEDDDDKLLLFPSPIHPYAVNPEQTAC